MEREKKQFIGAFLATVILIGAMCGFMIVDQSTQRYLPGRVGPLYLISYLGEEGVRFSWMGEEYEISPALFSWQDSIPAALRSLAPRSVRAAQLLGEGVYLLAQEEEPQTENPFE